MTQPVALGEFEQLVLLGLLHAGAEAYGVPIWRELEARSGRGASIAAVYKTLDRLEGKGMVRSGSGPPSSERGGRSRRIYQVTPSGLRHLRAAVATLRRMTDDLDAVLGTP